MASGTDGVAIRFSRRELELVWEAVDFMALPENPDDQRLILDLRDLLERAANLDIPTLRANLDASLARAHAAARSLSASDYLIKADGMIFVVRGDTVTTILDDTTPASHASALVQQHVDGGRSIQPNRGRLV